MAGREREERATGPQLTVPVAVPGNLADGCSVVPAWSEGPDPAAVSLGTAPGLREHVCWRGGQAHNSGRCAPRSWTTTQSTGLRP